MFTKETHTKFRDAEGNPLSDEIGNYKLEDGKRVHEGELSKSDINQLIKTSKSKRKRKSIDEKIELEEKKIQRQQKRLNQSVALQEKKQRLRNVKRKSRQQRMQPVKNIMENLSIGGSREAGKEGFDLSMGRNSNMFDFNRGSGGMFDFGGGKKSNLEFGKIGGQDFDFGFGKNKTNVRRKVGKRKRKPQKKKSRSKKKRRK